MTPEKFADRFPKLWHMAESSNWDLIREHGLLSTSALLDLFEYEGDQRLDIESRFRSESIEIFHPELGRAIVRDQKPMINDSVVDRYLDGMTPAEWYQTLNARVFFWVSEDRLERLLGAGSYRNRPHTVLTLDTASLLGVHEDRVSLSPINSGAIFPAGKTRRGRYTFSSFGEYDWDDRLKRPEPVVELAVDRAVPDVCELLLDVRQRQALPKA